MSQILLPWQRESLGKNSVGSIQWPISENLPTDAKNLADISYTDQVIVNFVPNFVAAATWVNQG